MLMVSIQEFLTEVFAAPGNRNVLLGGVEIDPNVHQKNLVNFFKRVLEKLLQKERMKYPEKDLKQIVSRQGFVRSLLGSCDPRPQVNRSALEDLLEVLNIHPFDF